MQVQDDKPYDDINITPMLDLAYVLLVIFILMTTASVQGLKVVLPTSVSKAASLTRPKTKSITVTMDGTYTLDTTPVTLEQLESGIVAAKAAVPDLPVIIRGGNVTQYQHVVAVLDMLSRQGITDVGIATQSPK